MGEAIHITTYIITLNWKAWLVILPTLGISLWYLVRQAIYSIFRIRSTQSFSPLSARHYSRKFFGKYFLIPFLFSLPIYLTAYDYGRWFTVTCVNFAMLAVSGNLPWLEFLLRKKGTDEGAAAADSPIYLDNPLLFYGASIIICILAVVLMMPHCCVLNCEIIRSPLEFFSETFKAN